MKCVADDLSVKITRKAMQKLKAFVELCSYEISGFGIVGRDGGVFLIEDVFILEQEVGMAHTDIDADALFESIQKEASSGRDTKKWGMWWHSHVNMAVSPSGTDIETIEKLAGKEPLISIIINKSFDIYCRVDVYEPISISITNVQLKVEEEKDNRIWKTCEKEIDNKVKRYQYHAPAIQSNLVNYFIGADGKIRPKEDGSWKRGVYGAGCTNLGTVEQRGIGKGRKLTAREKKLLKKSLSKKEYEALEKKLKSKEKVCCYNCTNLSYTGTYCLYGSYKSVCAFVRNLEKPSKGECKNCVPCDRFELSPISEEGGVLYGD